LELDGDWYEWVGSFSLKSSLFPTGRHYYDVPVTLGEHWQSKTGKKSPPLTVGKHTVRVAIVARHPTPKGPNAPPPVRCVSNAVEIKIEEDCTRICPDPQTSSGDTENRLLDAMPTARTEEQERKVDRQATTAVRETTDQATAMALAEDYVRRQKVDLSRHRLSTVRLIPSSPWMRGQHWIVTWESKQPSDGGQVFVLVGMEKKIRVVRGR
jgi:hypothetical protein